MTHGGSEGGFTSLSRPRIYLQTDRVILDGIKINPDRHSREHLNCDS
jgi:hypothetical protein